MLRQPRNPPLFPSPPLSRPITSPSLDGPPTTATLLEALSTVAVGAGQPETGWLGYLGLGDSIQTADRGRLGIELRSEEHTSELQSQSNLVCRLLLEKKNNPS